MRSYFDNPARDRNFFWILGPAGVGKTAIMRTVAETETSNTTNRLGATVFFSKEKNCFPERILPTIAYQLSLRDVSYQNYISKLRREDPAYFKKDLDVQFEKLFVIPHLRNRLFGDSSHPWIIILDGLDECRSPGYAGFRFQYVQRTIVELISTFVQNYPSASLVWVVASRPERHLTVVRDQIETSCLAEDILVHTAEAQEDLREYLRQAFNEIRGKYPYQVPPSHITWPTPDDLRKIADAASGFFMFASAVVRFVEDRNPVANLRHVLSVVKQPESIPKGIQNPFALLDSTYKQILNRIPEDVIADTKKFLACCLHWDGSLQEMCNIIGVEQYAVYAAFEDLYSVLDIPHPELAAKRNVEWFHESFIDYLYDPKRSTYHTISIDDYVGAAWKFWVGYFRILCETVRNGE